MKTILYFLIATFIFGICATNCMKQDNTKKSILIQAVDEDISSVLLSQSAGIISGRLKDFSPEKFEITTIPGKRQIQVTLSQNWDMQSAENLMIQKGIFEFYETYDHKELTELLKGNNHLFSLFNEEGNSNLFIKIGCKTIAEVEKVNTYLNTLGLNSNCKFAWSLFSENSEVCLYALRSNGSIIGNDGIQSVELKQDKESKNYELEIKFKDSAVQQWADATHRNIDKSIAILLDDQVIYAPVVKSVIENGTCSITGNFTEKEAGYFAALGNHGELPINFKVVK